MILDASGVPFPEKSVARQYSEALASSIRDTRWNLTCALANGWTSEEFRHWVRTGEEPQP
jgi:hypothetical protein